MRTFFRRRLSTDRPSPSHPCPLWSKALGMVLLIASGLGAGTAHAQALTIESWRKDDQIFWDKVLIPAFQRRHPEIKLQFKPEELDQMSGVKLAFDPKGLLNPGKVIPTPNRCGDMGMMKTLNLGQGQAAMARP